MTSAKTTSKIDALTNERRYMITVTRNLGMLLLAIYLICVGLVGLMGLSLGMVTAILAIVAGILILLGR